MEPERVLRDGDQDPQAVSWPSAAAPGRGAGKAVRRSSSTVTIAAITATTTSPLKPEYLPGS